MPQEIEYLTSSEFSFLVYCLDQQMKNPDPEEHAYKINLLRKLSILRKD